jgi:isocitrate/isopropylmalate dehydrogenase
VAVHRIAAIPGDGIGQEVIAAGLEVLIALQARAPELRLEVQRFDWGSEHYRRHGRMMPEDVSIGCARSMPSISAPSARRTSRTTSRSGACA